MGRLFTGLLQHSWRPILYGQTAQLKTLDNTGSGESCRLSLSRNIVIGWGAASGGVMSAGFLGGQSSSLEVFEACLWRMIGLNYLRVLAEELVSSVPTLIITQYRIFSSLRTLAGLA